MRACVSPLSRPCLTQNSPLPVKVTFVGQGFTRRAPKHERFIRPSGLRFKKAHVTHPEFQATFHLDILSVKKNPSSPLYTQLGVITKGAVIEVGRGHTLGRNRTRMLLH